MEKIQLLVGSVIVGVSGVTLDTTRKVVFVGERLAEHSITGIHEGQITDTRGTKQALYRTSEGRLIVYVVNWTDWVGKPTTYTIQETTRAELAEHFPDLADQIGLGRPLTLDEALTLNRS